MHCKFIGSGSISSYQDIETMRNGLDGAIIGQAAIGNPWIFTPHIPSREEIKETILKHLNYMVGYEIFFQEQMKSFDWILKMPSWVLSSSLVPCSSWLSPHVIVEFRKHLFQYIKGIPSSKEFKQKISTIKEYGLLVEEIQKFFGELYE